MKNRNPGKQPAERLKTHPLRSPLLWLAATGIVMFAACGKQSPVSAKSQAEEPAGIVVATTSTTATVEAIDYTTRTVTLKTPDGVIKSYRIGKDVPNFDRINVGDKVNATLVDELAVFVNKVGGPPNAVEATTVTLAPKGAKPGMIIANTQEITAKIDAIDTEHRTITIEEPLGKPRTVQVAPNVNLAQLKTGDDVVVRSTQAVALLVEKS
jgi:hypothetical protein